WDSVMMLIVDGATEDPPVLPIHRVAIAHGEAGLDARGGERVRDLAEVLASLRDDRVTYGTVRLEDGEPVHRVAHLAGAPPAVRALHAELFDSAPDIRLRFVPDAVKAEEAVISGEASIAYILP